MIERIFILFIGLVGLFFVVTHPEKVVELLQMIVNGASHLANSLAGLDFHGAAKGG